MSRPVQRSSKIAQNPRYDMNWDEFHRHQTINDFLLELNATSPLVNVVNIGKSYEGRDMLVIQIGKGGQGKPNVWVEAGKKYS